jgi:hypothetical protein
MITRVHCRHRSTADTGNVYRCHSPKLVGLKLVTEEVCGQCHYRDHEVAASTYRPRHLLPCLKLGLALPEHNAAVADGPIHTCTDPRYRRTTLNQCRHCPDYLFPLVTPVTPVNVVRQILDAPPYPQPDGWWSWPNVHEALRCGADEAIARTPPCSAEHAGRGVVIAGGANYFAAAYVTVRVLRRVGCQLPIELWHLAGEVTEAMRAALRPYGVVCVDADQVTNQQPFRFLDGHRWKGWQLKPYAIAACRFQEVLFLDADCYPTRNPEFLFDWPAYRERGAIFWPDLSTSAFLLPPEIWGVFGTQPGGPPLESGQILINKRACWSELNLALWYNAHADLVYHLLYGDKDTFNIAWRRLGTSYSMPQSSSGWDTHTILQYAPDGTVLFQHRCQDKFRLDGDEFSNNHQRFSCNHHNPRLVLEDDCFGFLADLKRWVGSAREAPDLQ